MSRIALLALAVVCAGCAPSARGSLAGAEPDQRPGISNGDMAASSGLRAQDLRGTVE